MLWEITMEAHLTLKSVRPPVTAVEILGLAISGQPTLARRAAEIATPTRPKPQSQPDHSEQFREDIRRRHEEPFRLHGWHHQGLNE
jgi:hypothetical protein